MITGYIGQRNSGKTLTMTIDGYIKYTQGYKIFCNYHVNFPHTRFEVDDLLALAESGKPIPNSHFMIDEYHINFGDARSSGKARNRIISYWLNMSSKNMTDISYSTQFSRQVDIRLRLNTEIVVESVTKSIIWATKNGNPQYVTNQRPKPTDFKSICYVTNIITQFSDTSRDKVLKRSFKANKYFKLYDTREVVKMEKDMFDRAKENKNVFDVPPIEKLSVKDKRREQHQNRLAFELVRNNNMELPKKIPKELKGIRIEKFVPDCLTGYKRKGEGIVSG